MSTLSFLHRKPFVIPFQYIRLTAKPKAISALGRANLSPPLIYCRNISTTSQQTSSLVSTSWLRANLPSVALLDASWHMPNTGRDPYAEYLKSHIPNAGFFGIDEIKDKSTNLPHMLPSEEDFSSAVGNLGISNSDHVVIYDSVGLFTSPRVYWTFRVFGHQRVSVLEGGLPKWLKEGGEVRAGNEVKEPKNYHASPKDLSLVRSYAQIIANANSSNPFTVIDARSLGRFKGTDPEPRQGLSSGHMPHSVSIPFQEVIDKEGQLLKPEMVRELLKQKGLDPESTDELVTSCGSGITASILFLALENAGVKGKLAVYDGSWTEYADRKESIILKS